jgi:hypothetical protein
MSTHERIENNEKEIESLKEQINGLQGLTEMVRKSLSDLGNSMITLAEQNRDANESLASLAKTVSALGDVLVNKNVLTGMELMNQKQANDDKNEKRLVDSLLEAGAIYADKNPINPESLIVVSRTDLDANDPSRSALVSSYLIVDLTAAMTRKQLVQDLLGRTVGDSVTYKNDGDSVYSVLNIIEVYSHTRMESLSEQIQA